MEDKIFDFMEKMYSDLKNEIRTVGNQVTKLDLMVENEIRTDIKLALEGYHDVREILTRVEDKLDDLAVTIENHDIEIAAIKSGK